jgi:hypothetical protein
MTRLVDFFTAPERGGCLVVGGKPQKADQAYLLNGFALVIFPPSSMV